MTLSEKFLASIDATLRRIQPPLIKPQPLGARPNGNRGPFIVTETLLFKNEPTTASASYQVKGFRWWRVKSVMVTGTGGAADASCSISIKQGAVETDALIILNCQAPNLIGAATSGVWHLGIGLAAIVSPAGGAANISAGLSDHLVFGDGWVSIACGAPDFVVTAGGFSLFIEGERLTSNPD